MRELPRGDLHKGLTRTAQTVYATFKLWDVARRGSVQATR